MKLIPLKNGGFALVDSIDFDTINKHTWFNSKGHALRNSWDSKLKRQVTIYMHRQIMKCDKGRIVDHKNHNGLDNQRSNLRLCNQKT